MPEFLLFEVWIRMKVTLNADFLCNKGLHTVELRRIMLADPKTQGRQAPRRTQ